LNLALQASILSDFFIQNKEILEARTSEMLFTGR
jgi:hypothetical protein